MPQDASLRPQRKPRALPLAPCMSPGAHLDRVWQPVTEICKCGHSAKPKVCLLLLHIPGPNAAPGRVHGLGAHLLIGSLNLGEITCTPFQDLQYSGREGGAGIHKSRPKSSPGGKRERAKGKTEVGPVSLPPSNSIKKSIEYNSLLGRSGEARGCQPHPTAKQGADSNSEEPSSFANIITMKHRVPVHFEDCICGLGGGLPTSQQGTAAPRSHACSECCVHPSSPRGRHGQLYAPILPHLLQKQRG